MMSLERECSCCVPWALDPELQFLQTQLLFSSQKRRRRTLRTSKCSGDTDLPTGTPLGVDSYEQRNILAEGMQRFEGIAKIAPRQPDVERLSERVICILGHNPSPYTLNGTNCYLVGTGKKRILIDAGESERGLEQFIRNLERCMADCGCTGLDMILITHMHGDHFGGVEALQERWGPVPVGMLPVPDHQLSLFTIRNIKQRGLEEAIKAGPSPFTSTGAFNFNAPGLTEETQAELPDWPDEDLSWDWAGRTKVELQRDYWYMVRHAEFYEHWLAGAIPSARLEHGQRIRTDGATLRVLFTPGHAENHATFILEEEKALFSGDHVLGFGTTHLQDLQEYMNSLRAMQAYVTANSRSAEFPTAGVLYPGHGPHIEDGMDLLTRYIAHRDAREKQVREFLRGRRAHAQPLSSTAIARALYTATEQKRMSFARENVEKVLVKLYREGLAECFLPRGADCDSCDYVRCTLPQTGYLRRIDAKIAWQVTDRGGDGKTEMPSPPSRY